MTWAEACDAFLARAHALVSKLFEVKGLTFVSVSKQFEVESGALTTKQIKKSRIGHSLQLLLELLRTLSELTGVVRDFATDLELDGDQGSEDIHNFRKFSENVQSNLNLLHSQSLSNYFRPDAQRAYAEQMAKFFAGMAHRTGVYRFKYKVAR